LRLLCYGAAVTAPDRQAVHDERSLDVLLSAHLATYRRRKVPVGNRDELDQAARQTVVANLLGDPTLRVARYEVCDDADPAVIETAEQTVLELIRHG